MSDSPVTDAWQSQDTTRRAQLDEAVRLLEFAAAYVTREALVDRIDEFLAAVRHPAGVE